MAKIPIGYVAAGTLTMTVNSDAPGPWRGTLSQPIFSIDRSQVLFPEGSLVVGRVVRISGINEAINNRLGLLPIRGDSYRLCEKRRTSLLQKAGPTFDVMP